MIVERVHDMISFGQFRWMRPYIDFDRNKRSVAKK